MTISTLAQRLGLSESTVSKALNDRPDVSEEVKAQVRSAAKTLGYVPNLQAQRLARKASDTLGVFLLNRFARPVHEYFGYAFLGGIMDEAEERGKDVLILNGPRASDDPAGALAGCLALGQAKGVEGVILIGLGQDAADRGLPAGFAVPVVSFDTPIPSSRAILLSCDNAVGVSTLTQAVLKGGASRLVYLGLRGDGYVARERKAGFCSALAARQASAVPPAELTECPLNRRDAREWALARLTQVHRPDGIVCATDLQALGVLDAAQALGIGVPNELQVTGFDAIPLASEAAPTLTTWAQDPVTMGRLGVAQVYATAQEGRNDTVRLCPGRPQWGQSTRKGVTHE